MILSYKNHAIDEFLSDLIERENSFRNNYGKSQMIRIGGGCNVSALRPYLEWSGVENSQTLKTISKKIEDKFESLQKIRLFRDQWKSIMDMHVMIKDQGQLSDIAMTSELKKEMRAISHNAVQTLHIFGAKTLAWSKILEQRNVSEGGDVDATITHVSNVASFNSMNNDPLCDVLVKGTSFLTSSDLEQLIGAVAHYGISDISEILFKWMSGFMPLPKCAYHDCHHVVTSETCLYCEKHQCKFEILTVCEDSDKRFLDRCVNDVLSSSEFCPLHKCVYDDCREKRVSEKEMFCYQHICFICLENGSDKGTPARVAKAKPPRNTCEDHGLCSSILNRGKLCRKIALPGGSFCNEHHNRLCSAKSLNGRPCDNHISSMGSSFCSAHFCQLAEESSSSTDSDSEARGINQQKKCHAKNKKGKDCKAPPLAKSRYCRDHHQRFSDIHENTVNTENMIGKIDTRENALQLQVNVSSLKQDHVSKHEVNTENEFSEGMIRQKCADDIVDILRDDEEQHDIHLSDDDEASYFLIDTRAQDDEDEYEEPENMQHLRDVYEEDEHISFTNTPEMEFIFEESTMNSKAVVETSLKFIPPCSWSWSMTIDERWLAIQSLLCKWDELMKVSVPLIIKEIDVLKKNHYQEKVKLKARVFEDKSVIGGTIVGCISRLEAIRSTNPFAVLVEEASEVLEPLLFACLSKSTCKLEMIGDHLQLQPSTMTKFEFERINKMYMSLFERLIRAPSDHSVPMDVLSVQRRMRTSICDLTRGFYTDITDITDHPVCHSRVINLNSGSCEGGGREVPGVLPHLFFWSNNGKEEKASVGLSKVNKKEAGLVCHLAQYLVKCGVPNKSIAILTTYKGQLKLIQKTLSTLGLYNAAPRRGFSSNPSGSDRSVTLSTVDRFQGDEADIVIVSLVIDGKSRTPFVKLVNRMIVLLSRARIGMYIIGNEQYFEKSDATHWSDTLTMLQKSAVNDSSSELARSCRIFSDKQIGPDLPLCCPLHRTSEKRAKDERDLALTFCQIRCEEKLSCGHICNLPCHWGKRHKARCDNRVVSPCTKHPRSLICNDIIRPFLHTNSTLEYALSQYRCDVLVEVRFPCGHNHQIKCSEEDELTNNGKPYPQCNQSSILPYVYSGCKHSRSCKCFEYFLYENGLSSVPPCEEIVDYTPSCGHSIKLKCHQKLIYEKNASLFRCTMKVEITLPRCGHEATLVPCPEAQKIDKSWSGVSCTTPGHVEEGVQYGPKDFICSHKALLTRKCGHEEEMTCEKAFERCLVETKCREIVKWTSPECGHSSSVECHLHRKLSAMKLQTNNHVPILQPTMLLKEEEILQSGYSPFQRLLKCRQQVNIERLCKHVEKMPCYEAFMLPLKPCRQDVKIRRPLCGHSDIVLCCQNNSSLEQHPWPKDLSHSEVLTRLFEQGILSMSLPAPAITAEYLSTFQPCTQELIVCRSKTCGHTFKAVCSKALKYIGEKRELDPPPCSELVTKLLPCGHMQQLSCSRQFEDVPCQEMIQNECWNFSICGQKLSMKCGGTLSRGLPNVFRCNEKTKTIWTCASGLHSFNLNICWGGLPDKCPSCSMEQVKSDLLKIKGLINSPEIGEDLLFSQFPLQSLPSFRDCPYLQQLQMNRSTCHNFLQRQCVLLERFYMWLNGKRFLKNDVKLSAPLYKPTFIPVFTILEGSENLRKLKEDKIFDEKKIFPVSSFHGFQCYEISRHNIDMIVRPLVASANSTVTVVFGMAFSLLTLRKPHDMPTGKKSHNKLSHWVQNQIAQSCFDSLLTQDPKTHVDNLFLWDPFTVYPTHFMALTSKEDFTDLLQKLPIEAKSVIKDPSVTSRSFPSGLNVVTDSFIHRPVRFTISKELTTRIRDVLENTMVPGATLMYPWDGRLSETIDLPTNLDANLREKLHFINGPKHNVEPFAGINLLKHTFESFKRVDKSRWPEFSLLMSLELIKVVENEVEPSNHINDYMSQIARARESAHPLLLLALARLEILKNALDRARKILLLFKDLYFIEENESENTLKMWLSSEELNLLDTAEQMSTLPDKNKSENRLIPNAEWSALKFEGLQSKAMDELMNLVGILKVKQEALRLFKTAAALKDMDPVYRRKNQFKCNYIFLGNPGCGKTTVARLFGQILQDSGLRSGANFVETTAQKVKDDGPTEFRLLLDKVKGLGHGNNGGVVFIDEAYDLDPINDFKGKPIVNEILTVAEGNRESLSLILAGYEKNISETLYAYNKGFRSRFQELAFEDFDEDELLYVWNKEMADNGWTDFDMQCPVGPIVMHRLSKAKGTIGFGNARAVRALFEQATKAAMSRDDFNPHLMTIKIEDVLGVRPTLNPKLQAVIAEVNGKIGWRRVKDSIQELVNLCDTNYEREMNGIKALPVTLNRCFLGNPGT